MEKRRFDAEFDDFYNTCLTELKSQPNWSEAMLPQLERFVTITIKLKKLNTEIVDQELTVQHTNKADKTNTVSNPAWRMFLQLDEQANKLADKLKLSMTTAPIDSSKGKEKKGFDLTPMKLAK
jgi:hypothetical protein